MHTLFSELKHSAAKRKIPFHLSYGELLQFCLENDFYRKSPKFTKDSLTIDRILPIYGYTITNIQVLTNTENVAKGNAERKKHSKHYQQSDDPF